MNNEMTKNDLAAAINALKDQLGQAPLAAWKVRDLTKDQLVEIYDALAFETDELTEENDPGTSEPITLAEALDPTPEVNEDNYGKFVEETEPSIGRAPRKVSTPRPPLYKDGLRRCGCCGNYFAPEAFGAYKNAKDGLANYTRDHTNEYRAAKKAAATKES